MPTTLVSWTKKSAFRPFQPFPYVNHITQQELVLIISGMYVLHVSFLKIEYSAGTIWNFFIYIGMASLNEQIMNVPVYFWSCGGLRKSRWDA